MGGSSAKRCRERNALERASRSRSGRRRSRNNGSTLLYAESNSPRKDRGSRRSSGCDLLQQVQHICRRGHVSRKRQLLQDSSGGDAFTLRPRWYKGPQPSDPKRRGNGHFSFVKTLQSVRSSTDLIEIDAISITSSSCTDSDQEDTKKCDQRNGRSASPLPKRSRIASSTVRRSDEHEDNIFFNSSSSSSEPPEWNRKQRRRAPQQQPQSQIPTDHKQLQSQQKGKTFRRDARSDPEASSSSCEPKEWDRKQERSTPQRRIPKVHDKLPSQQNHAHEEVEKTTCEEEEVEKTSRCESHSDPAERMSRQLSREQEKNPPQQQPRSPMQKDQEHLQSQQHDANEDLGKTSCQDSYSDSGERSSGDESKELGRKQQSTTPQQQPKSPIPKDQEKMLSHQDDANGELGKTSRHDSESPIPKDRDQSQSSQNIVNEEAGKEMVKMQDQEQCQDAGLYKKSIIFLHHMFNQLETPQQQVGNGGRCIVGIMGLHGSGTHALRDYVTRYFDVDCEPRPSKQMGDGTLEFGNGFKTWKHTVPPFPLPHPHSSRCPDIMLFTVREIRSWMSSLAGRPYELFPSPKKRRPLGRVGWMFGRVKFEAMNRACNPAPDAEFESVPKLWAEYVAGYQKLALETAHSKDKDHRAPRCYLVRHEDIVLEPEKIVDVLKDLGMPRNGFKFEPSEASACRGVNTRTELVEKLKGRAWEANDGHVLSDSVRSDVFNGGEGGYHLQELQAQMGPFSDLLKQLNYAAP